MAGRSGLPLLWELLLSTLYRVRRQQRRLVVIVPSLPQHLASRASPFPDFSITNLEQHDSHCPLSTPTATAAATNNHHGRTVRGSFALRNLHWRATNHTRSQTMRETLTTATVLQLDRRGIEQDQTHAERRKESTALGRPVGHAEYVGDPRATQ